MFHEEFKPSSTSARHLRQFAAAWLVFLLAAGLHQGFVRGHQKTGVILAIVALVVGVLGLIKPAAIRWIYAGAMALTFPIGWVISRLMVLLMFYGIITPVALFFKLRGRDLLCRKPRPGRVSFWTPKSTPQDVRSYFRQF